MTRGYRVILLPLVTGMVIATWSACLGAQSQSLLPPQAPPTPVKTDGKAVELPVSFARSGHEVEARLKRFDWALFEPEKEVKLWAFGRKWTVPAHVHAFGSEPYAWCRLKAPDVRVPTVITILDPRDHPAGELVVYPDQDVQWDKKIHLYCSEARGWFAQWAAATGLPVDEWHGKANADETALLISHSHIDIALNLVPAQKKAAEGKVNLLAFSDYPVANSPVDVLPRWMSGGMSETGKEHWPRPMHFTRHVEPFLEIANRWAWVSDDRGLPLVEQVAIIDHPAAEIRPVVASYLPWWQQLGRNEYADATLLALLSASAKAAPVELKGHPVGFIYPPREKLDPKDRPVLCAIRSVEPVIRPEQEPDYNPPMIHIMDLRGKDKPAADPDELSKACRASVEGQAAAVLLILGDDPMLDEWIWLKLDRAKKAVGRPGVVWLSDDELPPSRENQVRLMLTLTELGVPLAPRDQKPEEEKK